MTAERVRDTAHWDNITIPLATGGTATRGNAVGAVYGTHTATEITSTAIAVPMIPLGMPLEDRIQANGDVDVNVELFQGVDLEYFDNDNVTLASNFLQKVYFKDAHTVSTTNHSSSNYYAVAGIVWDVDSVKGVGIQRIGISVASLLS